MAAVCRRFGVSRKYRLQMASIATPNKASPDWPINLKRPNGKRKPFPPRSSERSWP